LIVRAATAADVPGVLPMVGAICRMHQELDPARFPMRADVVERYAAWLPERAVDPRSVFLVAAESKSGDDAAGERLVGFLVAGVEANIPIYRVAAYGFIHDVWVEPDSRGKGAARAMVEQAVRRFGEIGVREVRLETAAMNDGARALFLACGFRIASVELMKTL